MSSPSFRFQQFEVYHDRCGMKVGTDGVLLGAWVQPGSAGKILDVGTGSGVIALILAQRSSAEIVGVELEAQAAAQAEENVLRSPWPDRIRIVHGDFRDFSASAFDLIVSNPPFYQNALKAPSPERNHARHTVALSYSGLIEKAEKLLSLDGRLAVVLPILGAVAFEDYAWGKGLYLHRRCEVSTLEGQPPKRVLLEFSRRRSQIERTFLAISSKTKDRTDPFSALTSDLYLKH
jgi:tRNA1Val (adenine37-N6)-methyltransferase